MSRVSQGPFELTKFPSGQSNPTYRITRRVGRICAAPQAVRAVAARRRTRSTASIACCRRCTRSASRCRGRSALCSDPEVIGAIFYVMELAKGRPYANGALPEFDAGDARPDVRATDRHAGRPARIDPDAAELGDFGKPGNYFERQVTRWTRQYRDCRDRLICPRWSG